MTAKDVIAIVATWIGVRTRAIRFPLALVGAVLLVVGCNTPWARFPGYPGKASLAGFPGGARLYPLILTAAIVLFFVRVPGRRGAAVAAGLGALTVVVINIIGVAHDGGGTVNVGYGAWVALIGSILFPAAALGLPEGEPAPNIPELPTWVEIIVILVAVAAVLGAFVEALRIDTSSHFISHRPP